jgi:hypothetical protein
MTTPTEERRFRRQTARGVARDLAEPLPGALAGIEELAERVRAHRGLAAKAESLRARTSELRKKIAEVENEDRRAAQEASLAGQKMPRRKTPALRRKLEAAESELQATSEVLPRSADSLLVASWDYIGEAANRAAAAEEQTLDRAAALMADLDRELVAHGEAISERIWLTTADGGATRVDPFVRRTDSLVNGLRQALANAFSEYVQERENRRAEAHRQAEWRREHERERARHAHELAKEAAAARIVTEGMAVVERGARREEPEDLR